MKSFPLYRSGGVKTLLLSLLTFCLLAHTAHADRSWDDEKPIVLLKPVEGNIEQGFGIEYNPVLRREQMNTGILFNVNGRQPVIATADGTIALRRTGRDKLHVTIRHEKGFESHFNNLSEALHEPGAYVQRGDVIGYIDIREQGGSLYYEFHFRGNAIDPIPFFEDRDFS